MTETIVDNYDIVINKANLGLNLWSLVACPFQTRFVQYQTLAIITEHEMINKNVNDYTNVSVLTHLPMMFPASNLLWKNWIEIIAMGLPYNELFAFPWYCAGVFEGLWLVAIAMFVAVD